MPANFSPFACPSTHFCWECRDEIDESQVHEVSHESGLTVYLCDKCYEGQKEDN